LKFAFHGYKSKGIFLIEYIHHMAINTSILNQLDAVCASSQAQWIAVTKLRSVDALQALYKKGKKVFGENKAQELCDKYAQLPKDIDWHFIGHLQTNKVKLIVDKVSTIHSVDSLKLLQEIQKESAKLNKIVRVFLQVHIAQEETKYGFLPSEILEFFETSHLTQFPNVDIVGLMAMASFTGDKSQIRREFTMVKELLDEVNHRYALDMKELSMGMSGDYEIALECGATWIRVGSILYNA